MDTHTKIYIELTEEQKEKLFPLFDRIGQATESGKPIMLLSQIYYTGKDAVAICNVTTHEEGIELQKLLSPKNVGKYAGDTYANRALKKARKS